MNNHELVVDTIMGVRRAHNLDIDDSVVSEMAGHIVYALGLEPEELNVKD